MTLLKILIGIILLCTPPYGWLALLVWFAFAEAAKKPKKENGDSGDIEAMAVKVNNGRCEIFKVSSGAYLRTVGSDVVQASISGNHVAAVTRQGRVEIYDASSGSYRRALGNDAVNAQIQGDEVAITTQSGRVELYRVSNGAYLRAI